MKKIFFFTFMLFTTVSWAQQTYTQRPYQNAELSPEQRAEDLLHRLTLEEKVTLMQNNSRAIPRLGIKPYEWWSEALHGIARNGVATVFPQSIGMAASFNDTLLYQVFDAVSDEGRVKNRQSNLKGEYKRYQGLTYWTPNVNIFRDPRWGRGQETYGEDPYLSGRMGTAVVRGLQGSNHTKYNKAHACAKHYAVHSGPEWSRHSFNAENIELRDLSETYLPAFKQLVQKAKVKEIMCAYNRFEGEPCCGSNKLLHQILRNEWGFDGIVVTDCGAIGDFYIKYKHNLYPDAQTAAVVAVSNGTDLECGSDFSNLINAVKENKIDEERINNSVRRLLKARFELGEMEPEHPFSDIHDSVVDCMKHRELALKMARESMVLLQNKKNILPLKKNSTIAVVGPNANDSVMQWGNYNGTPSHTVTLLKALQNRLTSNKVIYEPFCGYTEGYKFNSIFGQCSINGKKGFEATYWNNKTYQGEAAAKTQMEAPFQLDSEGATVFAPGVNLKDFTAIYKTVFHPTYSGTANFRLKTNGNIKFIINGETKDEQFYIRNTSTVCPFPFEKNKEYHIEIHFEQVKNIPYLHLDLVEEVELNMKALTKQLNKADVIIFAGGISPKYEGEAMNVAADGFKGGDRTKIELPAVQREMMKRLKKTGKKIILVNFSGCAMALAEESSLCDAIIQAWYPGQEGGTAICDILFGDYNPSGKLPVTFYSSTEQLPDYEDYSMKNRTYRYFKENPLYAFGYGLSYTTFIVGDASINKSSLKYGDTLELNIPVSNTGKYDGEETIQLYLHKKGDAEGPIKTLRNFKKVFIPKETTKNITLPLPYNAFEWFDTNTNTMRPISGMYEILYGTSSRDEDLKRIDIQIE